MHKPQAKAWEPSEKLKSASMALAGYPLTTLVADHRALRGQRGQLSVGVRKRKPQWKQIIFLSPFRVTGLNPHLYETFTVSFADNYAWFNIGIAGSEHLSAPVDTLSSPYLSSTAYYVSFKVIPL